MRSARRAALILALAIVALAPRPAFAQQSGPTYVVQEGDTLTGIAQRFGISVDDLAAANGLNDPSSIFPGMSLSLPGFEGVSGILETRPVGAGENLESLALRYGLAAADLARLNHLVNPARLYVDQPLIVPVGEGGEVGTSADLVVPDGGGMLALAARAGINPWAIDRLNGGDARAWVIPESGVYLPGDGTPADALPTSVASISLTPSRPSQGRTEAVEVQLTEDDQVAGMLGDRTLNFMTPSEAPLSREALQGIYALAEPGLVDLALTVTPASGTPFTLVQPVRIEAGDYAREYVTVPSETLDPANTVPEDKEIAAVVAPATAQRLWDGVFQFPTDYHETFPSVFGTRRNYNGTGWNYYHTGLDLYGNPKTEIRAPAPGVVVFAGPLTVRGNATYIDHGWGVYSGYLHQSQIFVKPGDRVEAGQVIGMVGATGRVTGPHLHWEIWVGGVPVQPLDWTKRVYPPSESGG
ncbi:MAG TPA: LysM peptidoglycan-binding domain-containing protein [Anaerolineales bacterium]|nr:LysM peptidoglycan-binding domain-containing protein [Anaerolineales bacterium]